MPTLTAISLINKVRKQTLDEKNVYWTAEEVLGYLNDAQREVVINRPDANTVLAEYTTVLGTRQEIPDAGLRFLEVTHNIETGYVVTPMERRRLDEVQRNWHSKLNPVDEVEHYVFDERFPKYFYLYPCPEAGVKVELGYSAAPQDITLTAFDGTDLSTINLDDIYANALYDYVMFCMYSKNIDAANPNKAMGHLRNFYQSLGLKFQADRAASPNNPQNKVD